jgi:hypothetical protein
MWAIDVYTSEEHYIMIPESDPAEVAYGWEDDEWLAYGWEDDEWYYINWHDATYQVQSIDLEFSECLEL